MILGNLNIAFIIVWSVSGVGIIGCIVYKLRRQKRLHELTKIFTSGEYPPLNRFGLASIIKRSDLRAASRGQTNQGVIDKPALTKVALTRFMLSALTGGMTFIGVFSLFIGFDHLTDWIGVTGVILSMTFAGYVPRMYFAYKASLRQRHIQEGMPDFIDLLVLCVDAGVSLDAAMARIVGQLKRISPVLSQEIQLTLDEINILPHRSQAFLNFQHRAGSDLVTYFVLAVNQTTQYGTPLSATLKTLAEESRRSSMLDQESRASRLPVLLSIPLILFILPPVISLSVGPGFILMLRGLGG